MKNLESSILFMSVVLTLIYIVSSAIIKVITFGNSRRQFIVFYVGAILTIALSVFVGWYTGKDGGCIAGLLAGLLFGFITSLIVTTKSLEDYFDSFPGDRDNLTPSFMFVMCFIGMGAGGLSGAESMKSGLNLAMGEYIFLNCVTGLIGFIVLEVSFLLFPRLIKFISSKINKLKAQKTKLTMLSF
ncbi:MAG: hypothetical protein WDK96_02295 [Candidatus Paceibacterota bacterium]|jgi:hypothetical protein